MRTQAADGREVVVTFDVVNEQCIIAAACVDDAARRRLVQLIPQPDAFLATENRAAWAALLELERRGLGFDPAVIQQIAGDTVDVAYLTMLAEQRPEVPPNLDFHVDQLHWDRCRATATSGPIAALVDSVRDPRESPDRVRALARQVSVAFEGHGTRAYLADGGALVTDMMNAIRQRAAGFAVYEYGVEGLDWKEPEVTGAEKERRCIPGAAPGQITVITGVSGSGKSVLTAHVILGLARQKRRVLAYVPEMGAELTLELLACLSLNFSRTDLILGRLNFDQEALLEKTARRIARWVTFLKNPFGRVRGRKESNEGNLDVIQGYIADSGADVFVADLFERALVDDEPNEEKRALFRIQSMMDECKCHGVLVGQQRLKDIEQRPDKRPTREGHKGSAAWVEVADTMIGVHRPALWKRMDDTVIEAICLKQRHGKWPWAVEFAWDPERGSIRDGRTIAYDPPGMAGVSTEAEEWTSATSKSRGKSGRRAS